MHLTMFPNLGPSSLPVVVAQPDERHVNKTDSVLEWYDKHRAYYNNWLKRSSRNGLKLNCTRTGLTNVFLAITTKV